MHLIQSSKKQAPGKLVPIVANFRVPGVRKMRGRRYNHRGEYIGPCGPPRPVPDKHVQQKIERARAEAAKLPIPQEGGGFDLTRFKPLPGRILVARGALIKSENGVDLPERLWRHEPFFVAVRLGDGVTACAVGDRLVFAKSHRPKTVHLGPSALCLAREGAIAAIVETV